MGRSVPDEPTSGTERTAMHRGSQEVNAQPSALCASRASLVARKRQGVLPTPNECSKTKLLRTDQSHTCSHPRLTGYQLAPQRNRRGQDCRKQQPSGSLVRTRPPLDGGASVTLTLSYSTETRKSC